MHAMVSSRGMIVARVTRQQEGRHSTASFKATVGWRAELWLNKGRTISPLPCVEVGSTRKTRKPLCVERPLNTTSIPFLLVENLQIAVAVVTTIKPSSCSSSTTTACAFFFYIERPIFICTITQSDCSKLSSISYLCQTLVHKQGSSGGVVPQNDRGGEPFGSSRPALALQSKKSVHGEDDGIAQGQPPSVRGGTHSTPAVD